MDSPHTVLGMSVGAFTVVHTLISLAGIGSGLVVLFGFLSRTSLEGWNTVFLATTVATSVTGFAFPFERLLPSHIVGALSLAVLAIALAARHPFHLRGAWRPAYVVSAVLALYLNVFVGVVQAFLKIPALHALAPKQTETPFVASQGVVLAAFIGLGVVAAMRSRGEGSSPSSSAK